MRVFVWRERSEGDTSGIEAVKGKERMASEREREKRKVTSLHKRHVPAEQAISSGQPVKQKGATFHSPPPLATGGRGAKEAEGKEMDHHHGASRKREKGQA